MDPNELRQEAAKLKAKAQSIVTAAEAMDRDLTDDEQAKVDAILDDVEAKENEAAKVEAAEKRAARLKALSEPSPAPGRKSKPTNPDDTQPKVEVDEPNFAKDPMKGFASPKAFFGAVVAAFKSDGTIRSGSDERLRFLATAGTDEAQSGSDPYGGFLVPEGMSPDLLSVGAEMNPLLAGVTRVTMDSPTIKLNARVDKNHSTSVSGGFTVSRKAETAAASASRGQFEQITLNANSLFGFAYATEELMQDSPRSVASIIESGFRDEFPSTIFKEMLTGTGVGEMEGILNCAGTIAQAKEGSQTADTIVANNVLKMRQRAWNYGRSVWLTNHDTYLQLVNMNIESTTPVGSYFLYHPGNGTDAPDTLLGRPVFFSEYAETLGDKGDIYLVDPSQYLFGIYQPLQSAESIHVRFDRNERAFRFSTRNDGKGWWRSALTPVNGANTLSPFVTLAARA